MGVVYKAEKTKLNANEDVVRAHGTKCLGFLIGAEHQHLYNYFYVGTILLGATASVEAVISVIDGMFALMAIPTMTSSLLLV